MVEKRQMGNEEAEAKKAIALLRRNGTKWVDLQFTGILGRLHHVRLSVSEFTPEGFKEGFPKLDGSSVKGFGEIEESDFRLRPVASTAVQIPWAPHVTRMIAEVHSGGGHGRFERDPRAIAEKAESHMRDLGHVGYFGPELEFFVVDGVNVNISNPQAGTGFSIDSSEAPWSNTGGRVIRRNDGYYTDYPDESKSEIVNVLKDKFRYPILAYHHEVAVAQWEVTSVYSTIVDMADRVQTIKWVIGKMSAQQKQLATFMPKLFFDHNASGMHMHYSEWTLNGKRRTLMFEEGAPAELSQLGRYAVGGLLAHARALAAITNPTTNSYRRLIPGMEAPVYIAWSEANRSAVVRIPGYEKKGNASAKRLEFRQPDPSGNIYLTEAAMQMAIADGVKHKLDPGSPVENTDIYHMTSKQRRAAGITTLPGSLTESLEALKGDNAFLSPVFPASAISRYMDLKRDEVRDQQRYPHPIEIHQYLDV